MYNGVYPAYIRPYTQFKPKAPQRKNEEEQKNGASSNREDLQERSNTQNTIKTTSYQLPGYSGFRAQVQKSNPVQNPNAQNINVSQIITDFKGTASAVGAPKEVIDEVFTYLDLIQSQAVKENPNKKIIQSNLKNASQVLDGYISQTLKTQSNVVENWIDALFLQNIDYKADPSAINEDLKLHLEKEEKETNATVVDNTQLSNNQNLISEAKNTEISSNRNYIPQDEKMKELFLNAKKFIKEDNSKTALIALKKALDYASETNDVKMQSVIYFETADLYNKNGHYAQALKGYKLAADMAVDENLIAKSYMKTGKIYDDAGLIEPAKQHWFSAIGYAGESENLPLQVKALNNLADIQSEIFDKKNAYIFANLANSIAEETQDEKVKGYSYKRSSHISEYLDDNAKALQYLKLSTKAYTKAQDNKNMIENYISAADIMMNVGNSLKARALLDKAYLTAVDTDNKDAVSVISSKIAKLAA
ncbi:hypothetical protein IJG14_02400 [bacterium]|nr:hypothetical protein [bacterium]